MGIAAAVLVGAAALAGCSSENRVIDLSAMTPVGYCAGQYRCSAGGESVNATFSRAPGGCYLGEARLDADGAVDMRDGARGVWTGNASQFDLCFSDGCIACKVTNPNVVATATGPAAPSTSAPTPNKNTGRCTGSVNLNCAANTVASCPLNAGCKIKADSTSTYCGWDFDFCGHFTSLDTCERIPGCDWESR